MPFRLFRNEVVPASYVTPEGGKLGVWQSNIRNTFKEGELSSDRIQRLDAIGFTWNPFDEAFESGFQQTIKHKEQYGTPNAPKRYIAPDGFNLGSWQMSKKVAYKKGELSPNIIQRLESIGFTWNPLADAFENGCKQTVKYKEQNGTPNAPIKYISLDKFKLGNWQSDIRTSFKNGRLSPDRIKRLEAIGFKWSLKSENSKGTRGKYK